MILNHIDGNFAEGWLMRSPEGKLIKPWEPIIAVKASLTAIKYPAGASVPRAV